MFKSVSRLTSATFCATALVLLIGGAHRAGAAAPEPGPWKATASLGLNLTQGSFSNNWRGGDRGNIAWVLALDAQAIRQLSTKLNWSNSLQLAYGQTAQQVVDPNDPNRKVWDSPDKSTDLILFESVGRFTLGSAVDPFVALRLDSQFLDQSSPLGTLHFNPIKLTETAGIARVLVDTDTTLIVTRIGAGVRQTIARYFTGTDLQTDNISTNDGGLDWTTDATAGILDKRVLYRGKLQVFLPLFFSNSSKLEDFDAAAAAADAGWVAVGDYWKSPDINFQNTLITSISKLVNVNLNVQFVYDKFDAGTSVGNAAVATDRAVLLGGVRRGGQLRQNLAIGLTYKLF